MWKWPKMNWKYRTRVGNRNGFIFRNPHEPLRKQVWYLQAFPMLILDRGNPGRGLHRFPSFQTKTTKNASRPCSNMVSSTLKLTKGFHEQPLCQIYTEPYWNTIDIDTLGDVAGPCWPFCITLHETLHKVSISILSPAQWENGRPFNSVHFPFNHCAGLKMVLDDKW